MPEPPPDATPTNLRDHAPVAPSGLSREVGLHMVLQALEIDEAPALIGRFEIRERLGRGGMGTVFRAYDPELQRDVALKVLDGTVDDAGAEAVRVEARALARLTHPNVVTVYELGVENQQLFLAMEYVPGHTLRERALGPNPPDTAELLDWFLQAGRGLQAAHDAGLVHRDIKPDNLLVSETGRVRVADFGLARHVDARSTEDVAGTPTYMAPEVLESGLASPASDQYAFCASLWRLLDPSTPPGTPGADISAGLRETLIRGLSPDPGARWPSMAELLSALMPPVDAGPRARQRTLLLQRVERLWIQGVLRASLADGPEFDLPMSAGDAHVDAPWQVPPAAGATQALPGLLEAGQGSLLILGEPGAGKTTTLLRLAQGLLEEARLDPRAPTPVVLLLDSLPNARGPVEHWIEQELVAKYGLPRNAVRHWIDQGELVLLLDGLDEIPPSRRADCIRALNAFRTAFGIPMAVTCRTREYDSLSERLSFGHAVVIDPLPAALVASHVGGEGVSDDLIASLRTPLIVGLLARSHADLPDEGARLPWIYDRYVEHQMQSSGLPAAGQDALLRALGFIAAALKRGDRTELWIEQLASSWVFPDGRHALTGALSVVLLTAFCLLANVTVGYLVEGDAFSGLLFGLSSVPIIIAFNGGLRIKPVERLRFSMGRLARLLPLALLLGLVFGGIYGMFYILWVNLIFGVVAGLVTTVTIAFEPSLQESRIRPNQGMRQSLLNGVGIGLLGAVLGAVVLGYVTVPLVLPYLEPPSTLVGVPHPERSAAAVAAQMLGMIAGMVRGGWAVLQHLSLRLVIAATTAAPLALVPLLDRAVELGLMRRVGGGYLFLHRTFQDYLAERYGAS